MKEEKQKRKETEREGADDKGWMTVQTHADEARERLDCDKPARGEIYETS